MFFKMLPPLEARKGSVYVESEITGRRIGTANDTAFQEAVREGRSHTGYEAQCLLRETIGEESTSYAKSGTKC